MSTLFRDPPQQAPATPAAIATAGDVKAALRRRHPGGDTGGMVGQWTCIEEWLGIDLLALDAWQRASVVGYEVKVSRSDMRRELLRPHKRADAVARTTEFYFAVPAGLYTDDEIAFEEPEWGDGDFSRDTCPGILPFGERTDRFDRKYARYGGQCCRDWIGPRGRRSYVVEVPAPRVAAPPDWVTRHAGELDEQFDGRRSLHTDWEPTDRVPCPRCKGKGHLELSRVEREAPTLWVPRDVGLVTVSKRGCKVVKKSPRRSQPEPIAGTRKQVNDLVRWVSHRPDPRHALARATEAAA